MENLYFYKGNFYTLLDYGKMKNPNGEWVDSVTYQATLTGDTYTRALFDFSVKFINVKEVMIKAELLSGKN